MADHAALHVTDLEVRYNNVVAVQGLDVTVSPGEIVGLIGPNGAGKSTTLAAIMGLLRPATGQISLHGKPISGLAPETIARRGLAFVPEGRNIWREFTVEENLRLGLIGRRASSRAADADLAWVTELFPVVHEFRSKRAGLLSGGQQQQVAIAQALVSSPSVLMLDEPSLGLAPAVVERVFSALAQIRDRGVAVLLVEQRAEATIRFATRTHVIRDGRPVLTIGPEAANDRRLLTQAYFGA